MQKLMTLIRFDLLRFYFSLRRQIQKNIAKTYVREYTSLPGVLWFWSYI